MSANLHQIIRQEQEISATGACIPCKCLKSFRNKIQS